MTNPVPGVRWLWMLLGGFLAEVLLFAVAAALYAAPNPEALLLTITPPACFVATFVVGLWIVRRAKTRFVLNGVVLGTVAALLYVPLFFVMETIPIAYVAGEALKIAGGAAAGFVVARGRASAPSAG